jgi:hypothetical protein
VRTRCGRSLKPLSYTNTMLRPCWSAFFFRPAHVLPALDRRCISLRGPAHRTLATPAQRTQNPPHMPGMKLLPSLSLDQIGHAPGRPQRGAIAQHFGTFFQALAQFLQLGWLQAGFAPGSGGFGQRLGSLLPPRLMPPTDRLPVNAQSSGHLALTEPSIEQSGRLEPSPFELFKITFDAFWISHEPRLSRKARRVTIL